MTVVTNQAAVRPGLCLLLLAVAVAGVLGGCSRNRKDDSEACNQVSEYQASRSLPAITAPEGLAPPGRGTSYVVPPSAGDGKVPSAACLARPPPYFRQRPGEATADGATPPAREAGATPSDGD